MNTKHGYKKDNTINYQSLDNPDEICGVHFLDTVITFSAAVRNGKEEDQRKTLFSAIFPNTVNNKNAPID